MAEYISQITLPNNITYNLKDTAALPKSGGILTGGLEVKGHIAGDNSTTTGHGLYSGGMYHNAYNNIILHGDATTGSSGIAFVSDKVNATTGAITNINAPSDRAFIQYHAYGVTTPTAEGTVPTVATSGEAGRLVIGIGNDSGDKIILQAPGATDIVHQMGVSSYPIPHTTNTNGSVGGTTTPVYVDAGVIKAGTALGASAYHADSYFALASHEHNRLNGIGRLSTAAAIPYNPGAQQGFKMVWNIYDSTSRTNDAAGTPSFDAGVINLPWDWGGYNGQIAISNTVKDNTRMQIRSANHIDNGETANPRYTPNYGAWREVVTATKATKIGDTNKPVYISATGQATAISYTIDKSVPSDAKFTDTTYSVASNGGLSLNGTAFSITSGGVTNTMLAGSIENGKLVNSSLTVGNKSISLGGSGTVHDILKTSINIGTDTSWDQYDSGVYYVASNAAFTGTNSPENTNTNNGIAPYRYGQLIVSRAGTGGVAQFYISHNDSNNVNYGIHYRTGWNNTYVAKWSVLLDSHNYTNYTVKKDGTGATGSWEISITGTATNVTGIVAIANGGTGVSQFTKNQVILSDNTNGKTSLISRAYSDSSSAGALSSSSTNFVTERDIYYGLPTINNAHNYTSGSNIFAPTTSGTQYQLLVSDGTNKAPVWTVAAFLQSATSTTNQTAAYSTLTLGNNAAVNSTNAHSQGILRLYSDNTTYTDIQSQLTKNGNSNSNKTFYLPQYTGTDQMYAVHAGSNNAVGSNTQPVYVAAGGRITVSNGTVGDNYTPTFLNAGTTEIVFPVQYKTFTIAQGATGTTLSSPAYNSATDGIDSSAMDIFVLTIVVNQNDISHLNAPIEWSTDTNNQVILYTDVATSGSVSGYILTARGCEAPADVSS